VLGKIKIKKIKKNSKPVELGYLINRGTMHLQLSQIQPSNGDGKTPFKAWRVSVFILVLYLSLPTFHFRGRKNEYSAQRG